jgi:hypothetical protein
VMKRKTSIPTWRLTYLDRLEWSIVLRLARTSVPFLRISMGIVFVWFGALKFFPGMSPAQDLALRTMDVLTPGLMPAWLSLPLLALLEVAIGVGFLTGRYMRLTLLLLFQIAGALSPLVLFPKEVFTVGFYAPTLEGQYIIKNLVLIGAGLVIGATLCGGRIVADPQALHTHQTTREETVSRRALLKRVATWSTRLGAAWLLAACGWGDADASLAESQERSSGETACTENDNLAQQDLARRQGVNYVNRSPDSSQRCGNCRFFKPDGARRGCGRCEIIPGRVDEAGYCMAWMKR